MGGSDVMFGLRWDNFENKLLNGSWPHVAPLHDVTNKLVHSREKKFCLKIFQSLIPVSRKSMG